MAFLDEVRVFLKKEAGLDVSGVRDGQLDRRVANFLRRHNIDEKNMFRTLKTDEELLDNFLDGLTINVTSVFRNADRWEAAGAALKSLGSRPKIWSAGCSKGAEAYTISIICTENRQSPSILGTDIDERIMAKAVEGIYTEQEMRETEDRIKKKYFTQVDGGYRVDASISKAVRFQRQDLLAGPLPKGKFDFIACRNVAIYFSRESIKALHANFASALNPGGYLFIGSTERVDQPADLGLRTVSPFLYQLDQEMARN